MGQYLISFAQSFGFVFHKELRYEVFGAVTYAEPMLFQIRPLHLSLLNLYEHLVSVLVVKWRNASQHFIEDDPKRPPVALMVMHFPLEYLGRDVLSCATESVRLRRFFGQAEIRQLDIPLLV